MQIHFAGAQEVLQTTRSSNQNLEVTILAHEPWTPTYKTWLHEMAQS